MPPNRLQQSVLASIELPVTSLSYTAGDTVIGYVQRLSETTSPVTVSVSLHSRIKTGVLYTKPYGNKHERVIWYKAEATVYSNTQCLFKGNSAQGMNQWPFSVTIPAYGTRDGIQVALSPTYENIGDDIIDPSTDRSNLFCEWWLEAQIVDEEKHTAIFPLFVRSPSTATDVMVHQCVDKAHYQQTIKAYKLDRGASRFSSRPQFDFLANVLYPTAMQISSRDAVPIRISVTERSLDPGPEVFLTGVDLRLQYSTAARNLEGDYPPALNTVNEWKDVSRIKWQPNTEIMQEPTSIGDVRVTWNGLSHGESGGNKQATMWPGCEGHYLAVTHRLVWLLTFKCAGKTVKVEGAARVMVYGPSEEAESQLQERLGEEDVRKAYKAWAGGDTRVPGG